MFSKMIGQGWVDSFRYKHPGVRKYSWWSNFSNSRQLNRGWRIDYVIVSEESVGAIIEAEIRDKVKGSDHCPVDLLIDLDKLGQEEQLVICENKIQVQDSKLEEVKENGVKVNEGKKVGVRQKNTTKDKNKKET